MGAWIMLILIVMSIIGSLNTFFNKGSEHRQHFSIEHFYTMLVVYVVVMFGFGMIYFLLASEGLSILDQNILQNDPVFGRFGHSIYFSGVTLMTVGYGDITPVGLGKVIALIEALIGYILPAAFFVQVMQGASKESESKSE